jgi:oxysterol-binding protein-related protein 8
MAVYPIIDGQKASEHNFIPRRASEVSPPVASKPAAEETQGANLIDFGDSPTDTQQTVSLPSAGEKRDSNHSTDISAMLHSTGKEAGDGPLIDFTGDVRKSLPKANENHGSLI